MQRNRNGYFYSKISVAYDCLRKYKYQYVDVVEPDAARSGDLEFGTAMHTGLNAYLTGSDGAKVFSIYWDSVKDQGLEYGRFKHEALAAKGDLMLKRFAKSHLKRFEPKVLEERMYAEIDGIALEGTGDVIGLFDGVPSVVDFKTSKSPYDKNLIISNPQMYIYAKLAQVTLGYDVKQIVYMVFCKQEERIQTLTFDLTKEKLDSMMGSVITMCNRLETEKEFPMNHTACVKGSFICPYWKVCYGEDKAN